MPGLHSPRNSWNIAGHSCRRSNVRDPSTSIPNCHAIPRENSTSASSATAIGASAIPESSDHQEISMRTISFEELSSLVGQEIGVSDWVAIEQDRINMFADATGD